MVWKTAKPQAPTDESTDITQFGEEIWDEFPAPVIAQADLGLCDMIHYKFILHCKNALTITTAALAIIAKKNIAIAARTDTFLIARAEIDRW